MLSTSSFESLKDHEIIPKELRLENFKLIVDEFIKVSSEINEEIKSRVIDLD